MVKTIWACELSGCKEVYGSKTEAEECEAKGIVGPEIMPGLILNYGGYIILCGDTVKGHERRYSVLSLSPNPGSFSHNLESLKLNESAFEDGERFIDYTWNKLTFPQIDSSFRKKSMRILGDEEFIEVDRLIHQGRSTERIRNALNRFGAKEIYAHHPAFEKYIPAQSRD